MSGRGARSVATNSLKTRTLSATFAVALASMAAGCATSSSASSPALHTSTSAHPTAPAANPTSARSVAWTITPSPNPTLPNDISLTGISCVPDGECWAVGFDGVGGNDQTLILHSAGNAWNIEASPGPASSSINTLNGVACVSATDCWAVGSSNPNGISKTLIQHYDGSGWTNVASPIPSDSEQGLTALQGIACIAANDCWAVGYYAGQGGQTLVELYNGTSWRVVPSPNAPQSPGSALYGVTCATASDCWAVGTASVGASSSESLTEQYHGGAWKLIPSPNPPGRTSTVLNGVSCSSDNDCWAVGDDDSPNDQAVVEQNQGSGWSISSSPMTPGTSPSALLQGVDCAGSGSCWAVGGFFTGTTEQTLIEEDQGSGWNIVISPNAPNSTMSGLAAIDCEAATGCWATGSSSNFTTTSTGGTSLTLIEHGQ